MIVKQSGVETSGISQDLSSSVTALIFTDLKPADKQWYVFDFIILGFSE